MLAGSVSPLAAGVRHARDATPPTPCGAGTERGEWSRDVQDGGEAHGGCRQPGDEPEAGELAVATNLEHADRVVPAVQLVDEPAVVGRIDVDRRAASRRAVPVGRQDVDAPGDRRRRTRSATRCRCSPCRRTGRWRRASTPTSGTSRRGRRRRRRRRRAGPRSWTPSLHPARRRWRSRRAGRRCAEREPEGRYARGCVHDSRFCRIVADAERVDAVRVLLGHDEVAAVRGERHLSASRAFLRQRLRRSRHRLEPSAPDAEPGHVVGNAAVQDVDVAAVDGGRDRHVAAARLRVDEAEPITDGDEQRHLVRAGVDGDDDVAAIGHRDRAL